MVRNADREARQWMSNDISGTWHHILSEEIRRWIMAGAGHQHRRTRRVMPISRRGERVLLHVDSVLLAGRPASKARCRKPRS